jgi:hypothetical protein
MLISCHWTNSIGHSEQQPIETIQCERIGAPDANVFYVPIPALQTPAAVGYERSEATSLE